MFGETGKLDWAVCYTSWGSVRDVQTPLSPVNNDGVAIYPRGAAKNLALKTLPDEAPYDCPIRFQGQWSDEENGLHYNRYRYYGSYVSCKHTQLAVETACDGAL